ncbi:MAG: sigma 54-interacting transcriptional regulator [Stomatobaculum sp.]|nr:sigma 54-interacting transcriptional regulator [Stomatobaculum sp.]
MAQPLPESLLPYTEILDNIDAGVALYDNKGNYLFVNTGLINWRNIPRAEFLTRNVHDFLGVLDVCVFDLVMERKRKVSRLQSYRNIREPDGTAQIRIVTGTPIFDEQGNVQYVIVVMQDAREIQSQYQQILKRDGVINYDRLTRGADVKERIIADSPAMQELLAIAENVAALDSTVLLTGESGSGKEVVAHFIHEKSRRKNGPMVTVNCAAFPENLIEAELFGYEKGAFTGANREGKKGLVEEADGGTLFLDEINSLPLAVQGKFLRTLEEKSVQRVGSTRSKKINFRLIGASNRNLGEMVKEGTFREDLYYRIQVVPLMIPAVRNRREDIIPLCEYFLELFCRKYNLRKRFSKEVLEELCRYQWPGNVREIRNFAERMVVMTPREVTEISRIPQGFLSSQEEEYGARQEMTAPEAPSGMFRSAAVPRRTITRELLLEALQKCGNRREKAAEYLGVSRRTLQYKIKEYRISTRCRYQEVPPDKNM